jgi:hypothetical protein
MPYSITRHADDLVWVEMDGHLALQQAECYFLEMWSLLDMSKQPLDLLVDGRRIAGAAPGARRRTEQVAHHPNMGHLAFVVSEHHLLLFAPLVKLVSGVGLFGDEHEALGYLCAARGRPAPAMALPDLPPPPAFDDHPVEYEPLGLDLSRLYASGGHMPSHRQHTHGPGHILVRPLPPPPASRQKQTPLFPPFNGQGSGDGTK